MDSTDKTRIRLHHWIEHNREHLAGYGEAAENLARDGFSGAAEKVRQAIKLMEAANEQFKAALTELPDAEGGEHGAEPHGHGHDHGHHHHD